MCFRSISAYDFRGIFNAQFQRRCLVSEALRQFQSICACVSEAFLLMISEASSMPSFRGDSGFQCLKMFLHLFL